MRSALSILTFFVVTMVGLGCSSTPNGKQPKSQLAQQPSLEGTWTVDMDSFKDSEEYRTSPAEVQPMITAAMESVVFEFTSETVEMSMSMFGQAQAMKSAYRILGIEGQNVTIETVSERGDSEAPKVDTLTIKLEGDTMIMPKSGNNPELKLKRKQVEQK